MKNSLIAIFYELSDFGFKMLLFHVGVIVTRKYEFYKNYRMKIIDSKTSEELIPAIKHFYKIRTGKILDFDNPVTFDEKLQWLKVYDSTPLKTICSDKYLVREYVKEKIGEEYLVPILGVWNSFNEIDFNSLPQKFVLKANHASGTNLIVKDKSKLDMDTVKQKVEDWLSYNFQAYDLFELHYRDITRKITAEEYIEQIDGNLYDYKIHCFNGRAEFVQVIGDRNPENHTAKQLFYGREWGKRLEFTTGDFPLYEREIAKPENWDRMLEIAEKLARVFCYVRVDLYNINGTVYFGEMTFIPLSGTYVGWQPEDTDERLGKMMCLPEKCVLMQKT